MKKQSYNIRTTFDVPESEKEIAELASNAFEDVVGSLIKALDHLDMFSESFDNNNKVSVSEINEYRSIFRNYKTKIKQNFNEVVKLVSHCLVLMSDFSRDTAIFDLMNSFVGMVDALRQKVNLLLLAFGNLDSDSFIEDVLLNIDNVKEQVMSVRGMVNNRIIPHIDKNILAKNWTDIVTDKENKKLYNKMPLFVELYKKKNKVGI